MGIFSLFGKKDRQSGASTPPARSVRSVRAKDDAAAIVGDTKNASAVESQREQLAQEQRLAGRATALKIDAIESEMSSEFVRPRPVLARATIGSSPGPAAPAPESVVADATQLHGDNAQGKMLHGDTVFDSILAGASLEEVPLFEEAAILFANGQTDMVEHLLTDAIKGDQLGAASLVAWAMLFDLYQINSDQIAFEDLSIAYASRFETSPPAWIPLPAADPAVTPAARASSVPSAVFADKLDAGVVKTLEKLRLLALSHPTIRLEFIRITQVDPIGCGLLLRVLTQLQKSGTDLVLVGASELVAGIRRIITVGRRDETDAPWLLLLELLALLNQEAAFEEASIDYCVTFEVSPPAFKPPEARVTTTMDNADSVETAVDVFVMPPVVEGRADALLAALSEFALQHNPARVDCAGLARIDVNAAGQLLIGLTPITGDGRIIEFLNVNHLVATLFSVLGFKDVIRIVTRRI
ncbi:MAG: hypothetical protein NVSMB6_06070 [Burkholderiaceae bacterium]